MYISADPSACVLLNSIWFDSESEVKLSDIEAKHEAKPKRNEAKRKRKRSDMRSVVQRSD